MEQPSSIFVFVRKVVETVKYLLKKKSRIFLVKIYTLKGRKIQFKRARVRKINKFKLGRMDRLWDYVGDQTVCLTLCYAPRANSSWSFFVSFPRFMWFGHFPSFLASVWFWFVLYFYSLNGLLQSMKQTSLLERMALVLVLRRRI